MNIDKIELQKILVPFDGSEQSRKALAHALIVARHSHTGLTLMHVIDLNKKINAFEQVWLSGYVPEELKKSGYELLTKLAREIPPEIEVDLQVEIGSPPESIITAAQDGRYDLIVMGSRGMGQIKSLLIGSVSQYVLLHAPCPVLIVR